MAAISHILLPRLFVPDKAILPNDTAVTMAYTGLPMTQLIPAFQLASVMRANSTSILASSV